MKANISIQQLITLIMVSIVVLVFIIIFTGKTSIFTQSTISCESKGGGCVKSIEDCPYRTADFECSDPDKKVCCLPEV